MIVLVIVMKETNYLKDYYRCYYLLGRALGWESNKMNHEA